MVDRLKLVGWSGWPVLIAVCFLAFLAPVVEGWLLPIRTHQHMENVTRTADRLCWDWVSVKERPRVSDNLDVFLSIGSDRGVASIFEKETGMPWTRSRAVGVGPHVQPYCLTLPPSTKPTDTLRVEQTAFYPGLLPIWHVQVHFPDVVSPGAAP